MKMLIRKNTDNSDLVTTAVLNTKIGEVEEKIPIVSGLVKKTNYDAKILDTEEKYFTTSGYNKWCDDPTYNPSPEQ